ncbi:MAG TPA: glycosyltransferase family 4 protein [Chthoniobacterales bacterium]|nr:glycosyltransferase family 4 protein [Chthoniobacterales bacterium]
MSVRLLIHTRFHPSVGGIETVAALLVPEWIRAGESVTVVTDVKRDPSREKRFDFPLHHRPSRREWVRLLRSHDLLVHFNISLRAIWPLLVVPRRFVAVHHGYYTIDRDGRRDWKEKLKLRVARRAAKNIAVSEAVGRRIAIPCAVIPNPYDASVYHRDSKWDRAGDLIFVGRLVSDKGADTLLRALAILVERKMRLRLTIVGDGPERAPLEKLTAELKLEAQVAFVGSKVASEIADLLRRHQALVVPSLWEEPFGVVALEGIACGCAVIGSSGGGLPEAIGPCGVTFPNGDATALAGRIGELYGNPKRIEELLSHADDHLAQHLPSRVAARYLEVMRSAV